MEATMAGTDTQVRYQALADDLAGRIARGQLKPGDRLPSVRELCRIHTASPATVTHALHLLEDRSLIEARPRSGFFVRRKSRHIAPPEQCAAPGLPQTVELAEHHRLLLEFRRGINRDWLGRARIDPSLYPSVALQRHMTQLARRDPTLLAHDVLATGDRALCEQLARRSVLLGCDWSPDEILVTHGETQAIAIALRVCTKPGDVVAIQAPSHMSLLNLLEVEGRQVVEIPSHPCDGLSVDALEIALQRGNIAACVFSANFPNPTCSLMSDEAKRRTVALLAEHKVTLIEDDTGGDLYFGERRPPPLKAFDETGDVLYCADLSTILGAGLSLGYVVSGRHRLTFEHAQTCVSDPVPLLFQRTAAAFMEGGQFEPYLRRLRHTLADNVAAYRDLIAEHFPAGTRVADTPGGYLLWVELPRQVDTAELQRRALPHGIHFAPGRFFCHQRDFDNCLRLNVGHLLTPLIETSIMTLGRLAHDLV
jgi:DNA-binding transcriptional MocR family regulator